MTWVQDMLGPATLYLFWEKNGEDVRELATPKVILHMAADPF